MLDIVPDNKFKMLLVEQHTCVHGTIKKDQQLLNSSLKKLGLKVRKSKYSEVTEARFPFKNKTKQNKASKQNQTHILKYGKEEI